MEMQFKNEIKKLADIVVWADALITAGGYYEEKYRDDTSTAYCSVKAHELWKIKTVVLEAIDRHTVYTNALNKDIADKAAKIDLLEKEIEGRKEGYHALKEKMDELKEELEDTKEALDKTIESWVPLNAHDKVVDDLKDAIKERDKCIMEKCNIINTGNEAVVNLRKEICVHKEEKRQLKEKLEEITKSRDIWFDTACGHSNTIIEQSNTIKKLKEENSYLKKVSKDKNDIIRKAYARYVDEACKGREEIMNECYEKLTKDDTGYTGFKQYTLRALKAQEGNEKKTKEFLCNSAEIIFYNKRAEEKRKEETKVKDIPCGDDSIE